METGTRVRVTAPHVRDTGEVLYLSVSGRVRVRLDSSGASKLFNARHVRPLERAPVSPGSLSRTPTTARPASAPIDKDAPIRAPAYLAWLRQLPCAACSTGPPSEASHHPARGQGRMGAKTCDTRAIPLCHSCHAEHHAARGPTTDREWVEMTINRYLSRYCRDVLGAWG